jgi:hypothetical protein|eukprot:309289-Prymnesium_polylepis.2
MELPEGQRADKLALTGTGRNIALNTDGMNPLQLATARGLRFMFQVKATKPPPGARVAAMRPTSHFVSDFGSTS